MMSVIGPVQSRCHDGRPIGKKSLRWKGFVEKVGLSFEWKNDEVMDVESRDNEKDDLTSDEEVNLHKILNCETGSGRL